MSDGATTWGAAVEADLGANGPTPRGTDAGDGSNGYYPLWWKFTAPCDGLATFDTQGTTGPSTDTYLTVYVDTGSGPGEMQAQNDDSDLGAGLSKASIKIAQNEAYYVVVGSYSDTPESAPDELALNVSILEATGTWQTVYPTTAEQVGIAAPIGDGSLDDASDATGWQFQEDANSSTSSGGIVRFLFPTIENVVDIEPTITARMGATSDYPASFIFNMGIAWVDWAAWYVNPNFGVDTESPDGNAPLATYTGDLAPIFVDKDYNDTLGRYNQSFAAGTALAFATWQTVMPGGIDFVSDYTITEFSMQVMTGVPYVPSEEEPVHHWAVGIVGSLGIYRPPQFLRPGAVTAWNQNAPEVVGATPWADESDATYARVYGPDLAVHDISMTTDAKAPFPAPSSSTWEPLALSVRLSIHSEHDGSVYPVRGFRVSFTSPSQDILIGAGGVPEMTSDGMTVNLSWPLQTTLDSATYGDFLTMLRAGECSVGFEVLHDDAALGTGLDGWYDSWLTVYRVSLT